MYVCSAPRACVCHLCGLCVPERRRLCIVSGFIKYYALLTCKCNDSSALWAAFESEINMETLWLNWLKVRTEIRLISLSPYSIFFLSLSKKGQHKQEKRGEKLRFVCKEKLAAAKIHVCVATFSRFRRGRGEEGGRYSMLQATHLTGCFISSRTNTAEAAAANCDFMTERACAVLVKDIFCSPTLRAIKSFYVCGVRVCVNYEKRENVLPTRRYQIT